MPEFLHCGHGRDVELVLAPRQVPLPSRVPPAPMLKSYGMGIRDWEDIGKITCFSLCWGLVIADGILRWGEKLMSIPSSEIMEQFLMVSSMDESRNLTFFFTLEDFLARVVVELPDWGSSTKERLRAEIFCREALVIRRGMGDSGVECLDVMMTLNYGRQDQHCKYVQGIPTKGWSRWRMG